MLAGPKRTQKYSIDPRGSVWANDESKFGHKLMEKMGWTKGKGLGVNMTGDPHHVIIRKKLDTKGVGCTNNQADNWLAHQDDFNSLLGDLKRDYGVADSTSEMTRANDESELTEIKKHSSLDDQAKKRKRRLHYHKFTKGKDLSLCTSGDLDKIMGKRAYVKSPSVTPVQSQANFSAEGSSALIKSHGVETTTSCNNIQEYFSKKMARLKENRASSNSVFSENNSNEDEAVKSTRESDSYESDGIIKIHSPSPEREQKRKSKKKRKHRIDESEEIAIEEPPKKKKSKKRQIEIVEDVPDKAIKNKKSKKMKKQVVSEDNEEIITKIKKSKKNKKNKEK